MTRVTDQLAVEIESVVGAEHIHPHPPFDIDGLRPLLLVKPASSSELAECLRICSMLRTAVVPAGKMTWLDCGNPLSRADVVVSVERMNRVVEYSPADLTATVEAGLVLGDFNTVARAEGQWLPIDPPGAATATLGAVASCAASGPLRFGFGTPRDYVIGLKLAHIDGTESRSGGKVVKNVAGYDMNKLYVGSFGTLAVISRLTFKLRPLPERATTLLVIADDLSTLQESAQSIMSEPVNPASILLAKKIPADLLNSKGAVYGLFLRFLENESAVRYQIEFVVSRMGRSADAIILENDSIDVWRELADLDSLTTAAARISLPVSVTARFFTELTESWPDCVATADIGAGLIRVGLNGSEELISDAVRDLRATAGLAGGTLFVERAPSSVRRQVGAWGESPETAGLMRSIKSKFDPGMLLSPGRFGSGI